VELSKDVKDILEVFEVECDNHRKLFLASISDESVIRGMVAHYTKFYTLDILKEAIKLFVKEGDDPIQIYDFAVASSKVRDRVVTNIESKENFNRILKETEERMKQFES
jgi:hypothetical protein